MLLFKGSGVAIATPFNDDKSINYDSFEKLIKFHISEGTDAIIVCGTTGEGATLSYDERDALVAFAAQIAAGRIPVIGGGGSNSTENAIRLSQGARKGGADGLLVVTPFYNKATQKGLIEHYTKIAASVDLPIILYNVPGRTGLNIEPATMEQLAKVENIVGVKEASGDITQIVHIATFCDDNFGLYAGNDYEIVPQMSLGGVGTISATANIIPRDIHEMTRLCAAGNFETARLMQLRAIPLIDAIFIENNPIPAKAALNLMGHNVGGYRLPLSEIEPKNMEVLRKALKNYGLI